MKQKYDVESTLGSKSAPLLKNLINQGKSIFTLDDACMFYDKGRKETSNFLHSLVKRKIISQLKSGLFLILKMGQENVQLSQWALIAHALTSNEKYYLSHYSAMRLYGMTTHPILDITIMMAKRRQPRTIQNFKYYFIYCKPEHFWGSTAMWINKQDKVYVSDIERTLLDCLARPDLCGGITEIVRAIWAKKDEVKWDKIVNYGGKFTPKSAIKRLGFILELLNIASDYIPKLCKIVDSANDYIPLDPNAEKHGKYQRRWHIQINMNIDELKASIWS